ncbi:MAG: PAS domain-containing protein [Desulfovibrionales bacterium]|nr:PAS domain-containing protein [Desulfovibrionales bacterium]
MAASKGNQAQPALGNSRSEMVMGVALIFLVIAVLLSWVVWSIRSKQDEMLGQVRERLALLANSRVEVLQSWLAGHVQQTERLVSSDLFRLYATDMDLIDADPSFLITGVIPEGDEQEQMAQLAEQLPLMQQTFTDFTSFAGFMSGRIVHRAGQSYIGSDVRSLPLSPTQQALIKKTFAYPMPHFSLFRQTDNGLVIDLFVPILSTASEDAEKNVVAVVMLTKSATTNISAMLSNSPLATKGERTRLMQMTEVGFQEIVPWSPGGMVPLNAPPELEPDQRMKFAKRAALSGQNPVFSLGTKVPELDLWVVQEVDAHDAAKGVQEYSRISILIAALIAMVASLLFGVVWWRTMGQNQTRRAHQFQQLATELEQQRNFLDSINGSIPDFIAVKNLDGAYVYANPALSAGVDRPEGEVLGLDDVALFGFDTGKRLEQSDEEALRTGAPVVCTERIYLKSQLHHFQITKVLLKGAQDAPQGIVSVFRDVTSMVRAEERKRLAIQQTVEALVKAIEFTDPYLAGHSVLMRDLSSLVAEDLQLPEALRSTVEIASHLSQIGKMFIDRDLLTKPSPLTDAERQSMQKHVEHAADILRQIDFELPVFEAIYQMNESLDGSGYPRGLQEDEITLQARILSVANSFCAMVRPRAYRPAMPAAEALQTLRDAAMHYDQRVVEALAKALDSARGQKIMEKAAR